MSDELIKIESNLQIGQRKLQRLVQKCGSMQPALKAIGEAFTLSTEERFDKETGPDGQEWQDVKPATRKRKKHPKILTEEGHLRGGIHPEVQGEDTLLVGTNSPYGAIHQLGGEIEREARTGVVTHFKRTNGKSRFAGAKDAHYGMKVDISAHKTTMPARPYLGVSRADEKEALAIIGDYLEADMA